MAKLNAKARNALPTNAFAEPGKRAYPINDASHARNALSRVSANGSPAEQAQVRAAVHKRFPGIGAKGHNRPGESMESMADRMHPVPKR